MRSAEYLQQTYTYYNGKNWKSNWIANDKHGIFPFFIALTLCYYYLAEQSSPNRNPIKFSVGKKLAVPRRENQLIQPASKKTTS
ncbi:MAG: hypothetical protein D3924_07895 [Candidatus Electrothrix sp. AR4]|nr:hypothetical protein [Candidatus Electrothrix sp. AR4]